MIIFREASRRSGGQADKFYPHFHPYVSELVKQLIEKSVPGLQATDTEYVSSGENDGTLVVLPDSTLASLEDNLEILLAGGEKLKISKGTQFFIPDEIAVTILSDDGTTSVTPGPTVKLPGTMVLTTSPRGLRFTLPDGSKKDVLFGSKFALASETE